LGKIGGLVLRRVATPKVATQDLPPVPPRSA